MTNPLGSLVVTTASLVQFGDADTTVTGDEAAISTVTTTGQINVGSVGIIGSIEFDAADGNTLTVTTTEGGRVRLNGPVRLDSDLTVITAGAGDGDIVFTKNAPVDSQASPTNEENDLLLTAGTAAVRFFANVGMTNPLGSLVVTTASLVQFGDADTTVTGDEAAISTVTTTGQINVGSVGIIGSIEFDAADGKP